jgi:hypothetical protein
MRMSLIFLARAHGERGDHHASRAALADIDALQVPTEYMLGPELLRARAWAAVAEGSPSDGLVELEQAIAMAAAAGAHALELGALHDLARLGQAADVARRLRELVDLVEGPLAPACALHAEALVAQDAPALAAASLAFEELGAILLAAEAAADGAVALRRALDPRRATAAEQRAGALHARTGGARTPALTAAAAARAALTPRELEIARLAARGLSNKKHRRATVSLAPHRREQAARLLREARCRRPPRPRTSARAVLTHSDRRRPAANDRAPLLGVQRGRPTRRDSRSSSGTVNPDRAAVPARAPVQGAPRLSPRRPDSRD